MTQERHGLLEIAAGIAAVLLSLALVLAVVGIPVALLGWLTHWPFRTCVWSGLGIDALLFLVWFGICLVR